jgi:hypothetical protein
MILVVKNKDYKALALKAFSYIGLVVMFYFYYNHMSDKFQSQHKTLVKKLDVKGENKKIRLAKKLEKLIFKEAEKVVDLLGQTHIRKIEIKRDRLYLVCDRNTNLEPLMVRYGVNALIRSSMEDIKIAIDLKFIVESKYEA